MKKRMIAMLMAAALCVSSVPFSVLAEDPETNIETEDSYILNGDCGKNVQWTLDKSGVLTISGTGTMDDYYGNEEPWIDYAASIKEIVVEEGVTSVGRYAFWKCTSLENVVLPESITNINGWAFSECTNLGDVDFPDEVKKINYAAFRNCRCMKSLFIPANVVSIDTSAFDGCEGLETIVVADDNTVYDSRRNCNAIIETDTKILLKGCTNTIVPEEIISIGEYAFLDNRNLKRIKIPAGVKTIFPSAFYGCAQLSAIELPESLELIDDFAFHECYQLKDVYYTGTKEEWDKIDNNGLIDNNIIHRDIHYESIMPSINPDQGGTEWNDPGESSQGGTEGNAAGESGQSGNNESNPEKPGKNDNVGNGSGGSEEQNHEKTQVNSQVNLPVNPSVTNQKTKINNQVTAKGKSVKVSYTKLKKKTMTIKRAKAFKISKAVGKLTFKKMSGNKKIKVSKSGKITIKKGLKKGTYKLKVKVTAAGNANYEPLTKAVTVKIKVK